MANKTNTTKLTKKDFFSALETVVSADPQMKFSTPKGEITADQMVEFIQHELDLLTRKNSGEKKLTATQKQNELLKQGILAEMEDNRIYTITEMTKVLPSCAGLSAPKVSSLVTQLVDCELVKRTMEKRRAYFSKATASPEA